MTDDLVTRLTNYAAEVKSRMERGVVPFCHLGVSIVGPMAKEAAARITALECQLRSARNDERKAIAKFMRSQGEFLVEKQRDCLLANADIIEENRFARDME